MRVLFCLGKLLSLVHVVGNPPSRGHWGSLSRLVNSTRSLSSASHIHSVSTVLVREVGPFLFESNFSSSSLARSDLTCVWPVLGSGVVSVCCFSSLARIRKKCLSHYYQLTCERASSKCGHLVGEPRFLFATQLIRGKQHPRWPLDCRFFSFFFLFVLFSVISFLSSW